MKKDKRSDVKLVAAFQSGEKKALAMLVKRWHLTFCKKAYWIVKDADVAKDIAQDSWQTIIAKIDTLKDTSSFGTWALRIVYSTSLDVLRTKSTERFKQEEFAKEQNTIAEEAMDNTALNRKLAKAIQDLPGQQQLVIKLFYLEEYSVKEISKTLDISLGTAKSRLFYAREKLKTILKNRNYEK